MYKSLLRSDPNPKSQPGSTSEEWRKGYSAEQMRDHGQKEAEHIIQFSEKFFELDKKAWPSMLKGDWRKGLVAGLIRERALVPNAWVADRLAMGATGAVSRTIREARAFAAQDRKARPLARELSKNV